MLFFFTLGALSLGYNLIVISTFFVFFVQKNKSILKNKCFLYIIWFYFFNLPLVRIYIFHYSKLRPLYGLPENDDFILFYKILFWIWIVIEFKFRFWIFFNFLFFIFSFI